MTTLTIRRLVSTEGAHARWSFNTKKWYGNSSIGDTALITKFQEAGIDTTDVIIEHGDYHDCPRCDGKGYLHGLGQCFRCYGKQSKAYWLPSKKVKQM